MIAEHESLVVLSPQRVTAENHDRTIKIPSARHRDVSILLHVGESEADRSRTFILAHGSWRPIRPPITNCSDSVSNSKIDLNGATSLFHEQQDMPFRTLSFLFVLSSHPPLAIE
jgi:hypothetical protein